MKLKYIVPLALALVCVWFCRHSIISMLPEITGDLSVCGFVQEPIAVDVMPIVSQVNLKHDDFLNENIYEAELENGATVQIRKHEDGGFTAWIKFGKDDCYQPMNAESSRKWNEYFEQVSQKVKLP